MAQPDLSTVNCPFMRSMLTAADAPVWDPEAREMHVDDLVRFVQAQPGDGSLDGVLKFFAVQNHGLGNRFQRIGNLIGAGGRFSTVLVGSDGDHLGDTRIYSPETGEFDGEQFARFTGFSTDGRAMTIADLGRAVVDANKRHDGSTVNAMQSAGEFALLCVLLGDADGAVTIADMQRLFADNEFPEGARENLGSRTASQWFALTLEITEAVAAEAVRIGHHAAEMKIEELKKVLELMFAPLLRLMDR